MICAALLTLIFALPAGAADISYRAAPVAATVAAGGGTFKTRAYKIDGSVCFCLRGVASMLNGTKAQFSVLLDAKNRRALTTRGRGCAWTGGAAGGLLQNAAGGWSLFIDGCCAQTIKVYELGGEAYLDIRDLACLFGFGAGYDRQRNLWVLDGGRGYPLKFDRDVYKTGSVKVNGKTVPYRLYTAVYASRPNVVAQQFLKIYAPLNADENSPVFMPLDTGGYLHVAASGPKSAGEGADETEDVVTDAFMGPLGRGSPLTEALKAASILMSKGFVVVTPAARGRDTTVTINGRTTEAGTAPACAADLKAAVRYLKYNDQEIPGDSDKIIVTGMSGGGAMTAIMGAAGDCAAYGEYLDWLGAAPGSDAVFAAAPYCPITDLDNANMAYEWMFYRTGAETAVRGGPLASGDLALAAAMAKMYASCVNGLGLTDPLSKARLSLGKNLVSGSYRDYFYKIIGASATKYFRDSGFVNEDGTLNRLGLRYMNEKGRVNDLSADVAPKEFLGWNSAAKAAALTDYPKYVRYMKRLKPAAAFDNGMTSVTGENDLFNTEPELLSSDAALKGGWNHFDPNLGRAVAAAGLAGKKGFVSVYDFSVPDGVARASALLDPMYYIADYSRVEKLSVNRYAARLYKSSKVCQYWRIRTGSVDRDTSQTVSLNLALALAAGGASVDYELAWGQPHSGWYDRDEFISWITSLPGCGGR